MNKKNTVSIVTPSFNQGKFLEETILSVISQDFPFIEYMVIDGGSSDNSVNIIKKYQNKIDYWVSEKDSGQANAINKGWKLCRGEIMAFLNSDDTYQPGIITKVVDAFENHPDWGMSYGDGAWVDENGKCIQYRKARPFDIEKELYCYTIIQPTIFIRRSVFESVGGLDEKLLISIDFDYCMRVATSQFLIGTLENVYMANSRMHSESKTSTQTIKFIYDDELIINRSLDAAKFLHNTKRIRKKALAFLYIRKSEILISLREIRNAKNSLLKAIKIYPFICLGEGCRDIISILFKITFSESMVSAARKIKIWVNTKLRILRERKTGTLA